MYKEESQERVEIVQLIICPTRVFVGVYPFNPGSDPCLSINKSQGISSIKEGSVGSTCDADAVSPEISLMGNC